MPYFKANIVDIANGIELTEVDASPYISETRRNTPWSHLSRPSMYHRYTSKVWALYDLSNTRFNDVAATAKE